MMTVYLSVPLPNYLAALKLIGVEIAERPETADALLLPGGGDLHPKYYAQPTLFAANIDEMRDRAELALLSQFVSSRRPIFGICRGLQLINVCFGGALCQHIDGHSQVSGADRLHPVRNAGLLQTLYGASCVVNSAHHQSVSALGSGLRAVQWAQDGVIEALRHNSLPIFAVQWHPERLCGAFARGDAADGLALLQKFFLGP